MRKKGKKKLPSKGVQSIEIGFKLLRILHATGTEMSLKDLAAAAAMSPSKVHMYLVSFRNIGVVSQNPATSRYELGQLLGELGLSRLAREGPLRLAERAIHTLREQHLSGSMFVSIWSERGPVIVVRDEGTDVGVPFEIRVGYHSSLFHTATGQVFMTFMHEAVTAPIRALEKAESAFHGHAVLVPSEEDLAEVVAQIRSSGLAIVEDHLLPGMVGMAVPIFDSAARLGAVLTLIGRSGSADFRRGGKVATWMKEAVAAAARA